MFRTLAATFAVTVILAFQAPLLQAKELDVALQFQNTKVWCWAASAAMIGNYLTGHRDEDCQVLSSYDRLLGGSGECCDHPERCLRPGLAREMSIILSDVFGVSASNKDRALSYAEIKREIDAGRPFIAALRKGSAGHTVVVSGYEAPSRLVILDPRVGRRVVSYESLRGEGNSAKWAETILLAGGSGPDARITNVATAAEGSGMLAMSSASRYGSAALGSSTRSQE